MSGLDDKTLAKVREAARLNAATAPELSAEQQHRLRQLLNPSSRCDDRRAS